MSGRFVPPFITLETRELSDDAHQLLLPLVFESDVLRAYRATLEKDYASALALWGRAYAARDLGMSAETARMTFGETIPFPRRPGWDHVLTVPAGFVTDFMSTPRLPVAYALVGNLARRAGVMHDMLYQDHLVPRRIADALLPEAMVACGQPWWRQWLAWAGVRIGGRGAYRTGPARKQVLALLPPPMPGDLV